jgi:HD superfamily phosphohydrolase
MDAVVLAGEQPPSGTLLAPSTELSRWRDVVRLGALLHDVGHVFMSHAGERALTQAGLPGFEGIKVEQLLAEASQALQCESTIHLAELFSYAVVTSKAVRDICDAHGFTINIGKQSNSLQTLGGAMLHSAKLLDRDELWIADLLSGPLDVDKQDYVPRDSLMAGVGVQLESHRCAEVLRVCDLEAARVVNDQGHGAFPAKERRVVITFSGISVVEDMLLSRMSLFLRVYHHHKVRLAERIAERAYEYAMREGLLDTLLGGTTLAEVLDLTDPVLFAGEARRRVIQRQSALQAESKELDPGGAQVDAEQAREIKSKKKDLESHLQKLKLLERSLSVLESRQMPVRAFAYGPRFSAADVPERVTSTKPGAQSWAKLYEDLLDVEVRHKMEDSIVATARELARVMGETFDEDDLIDLRSSVYVDLPPSKQIDLEPLYVYSHTAERDLVSYDKLFQPNQWLDALRDSKLICYVYSHRRFAHWVNAAAELQFAVQYGAMSCHLRDVYSRCDKGALSKLKTTLFEKFQKDIEDRRDLPVIGLRRILTPPSFLPASVESEFAKFMCQIAKRREELLTQNQLAVANLYRRFHDQSCKQVAIFVDMVGSTKFASQLKDKRAVSEADSRLALLSALQEHLIKKLNGSKYGLLPLKTEGDAALCIALYDNGGEADFMRDLREVVFGDRWESEVRDLCTSRAWPTEDLPAPRLRVGACKESVRWMEELWDVLGAGVTAMFVTEGEVKRLAGNDAAIAWLGSWDEGTVPGERIKLKHEKIPEGIDVVIERCPEHGGA